jgi:hypothetical protein
MTKETLDQELADLLADYEQSKKQLIKRYCIANNPYKVGDVFTDRIGSIKIQVIKYSVGDFISGPKCVYFGPELKKDGTPKKSGAVRCAYQKNEVKN